MCVGEGRGGGTAAVPENKPAPPDSTVVYVQHMERSEREERKDKSGVII